MEAIKTEFTDQEIIEYVTSHEDGFEYAQLQCGIDKYELEKMLKNHGFEHCMWCCQWKPVWGSVVGGMICQDCDEDCGVDDL